MLPVIGPVRTRRELAAFVALPHTLHGADPLWAAPLRRDVRALLSRDKNPFFEHAEAEYFLASRAGTIVGRVAAIDNRAHTDLHRDGVGFFGLFESVDDSVVARALLGRVGDWLRQRGLATMRGPVSLSTNDEAGLLVEGFATPPAIRMPHNPPYYASLIEAAGLHMVKDLLAYQTTRDRLPQRLADGARSLARRQGISVRTLDVRRFDAEVRLFQDLYNRAWERNWGFVPLTRGEIEHLARQLRSVLVPELTVFSERAGQAIGCALALPDFNVALRRNPSGRLLPGLLKLLWATRGISRLRVPLLGTLPEWRGKGVDVLLYKAVWENAYAKGYRWAEASWILEDNHSMRNALTRMDFEVYKTYRLYDRPL